MVWKGDAGARLAPCLVTLIDEIDARAPGRDRRSDGSIGDRAHQARKSDHNPDANGIVKALDITDDPGNLAADLVYDRDDFDPDVLFEQLRVRRDPRVWYCISDRRLFSSYGSRKWLWRPYGGSNPHASHAHISVPASQVNNTATWFPTPLPSEEDDMPKTLADVIAYVDLLFSAAKNGDQRGRLDAVDRIAPLVEAGNDQAVTDNIRHLRSQLKL